MTTSYYNFCYLIPITLTGSSKAESKDMDTECTTNSADDGEAQKDVKCERRNPFNDLPTDYENDRPISEGADMMPSLLLGIFSGSLVPWWNNVNI